MLLIDDILLSPVKGLFYIFKQIHKAAEEEFLDEENITAELSELYMMLETGKITEEEFDQKESELLNRLEQIEEYKKKYFEAVEESEEHEEAEDEDTVKKVTAKVKKKRGKNSA
ncbi:MAG: gas vesicle protein GvpG [Planctomycetes bacterium]|nr:gas vesicle protein GvpG [Planctomycetota bacterium]